MDDLLTRGLVKPTTELRWIIPEVIRHPSAMLVHAASGGGKSNVAFDLFRALTTGTTWLNFPASKPIKCLFIDGEQDFHDLEALQETYGLDDYPEHRSNINFLSLVSRPDIDLLSKKNKEWLHQFIRKEGIEFIILDNSRSLFKDVDENSSSASEGMKQVSTFLQGITNAGASCLLLHHDNKAGGYAGSTELERIVLYRLQIEIEGDMRRFKRGKVRGQGKTSSRLSELDGAFYEHCPLTKMLVLQDTASQFAFHQTVRKQLEAGLKNGTIVTLEELKEVIRSNNAGKSSSSFSMRYILRTYFPELNANTIKNTSQLRKALTETSIPDDF